MPGFVNVAGDLSRFTNAVNGLSVYKAQDEAVFAAVLIDPFAFGCIAELVGQRVALGFSAEVAGIAGLMLGFPGRALNLLASASPFLLA